MIEDIEKSINDSANIIAESVNLSEKIHNSINSILDCLKKGNKLVFFWKWWKCC